MCVRVCVCVCPFPTVRVLLVLVIMRVMNICQNIDNTTELQYLSQCKNCFNTAQVLVTRLEHFNHTYKGECGICKVKYIHT